MPSDYKDRIQAKAEELAEELNGIDFFHLSPERRDQIYQRAMEDVNDDYAAAADLNWKP